MIPTNNNQKANTQTTLYKGWTLEVSGTEKANGRTNVAAIFQPNALRAGNDYGIRAQQARLANR